MTITELIRLLELIVLERQHGAITHEEMMFQAKQAAKQFLEMQP